jgi:ketosteroid isomerase-like protein
VNAPVAGAQYSALMSEENVALVRRCYEMVNSIGRTGPGFTDPEEVDPELWQRLAPDFELHERPDLPDARVYRGREESKEFWRKTQELFAEISWEMGEFTDLGHAVVAETSLVVVGRNSDVRFESDETAVFWIRDGALAKLQAFPSKAAALAAAAEPL